MILINSEYSDGHYIRFACPRCNHRHEINTMRPYPNARIRTVCPGCLMDILVCTPRMEKPARVRVVDGRVQAELPGVEG
jgi:hypothetical protein